ncbi:uncharacterized protein LOC125313697 [Rhodamnia argentea]|uniref:Uncharacterized protein LOC125313697 n=1 Tax=Rhodamnia argentea TaxID=178133 RepID=A0ABM3GYR7_9MYRT|nr:uncharacterized protein LOC125313697 [Rhodamnia argentea]
MLSGDEKGLYCDQLVVILETPQKLLILEDLIAVLTIFSEEEICEDSLASKLLRWLAASVIHEMISDRSTYADTTYSERSDLKMLNSLLQFVKETSRGRSRNASGAGKALAAAILYLQQLLGTDCRVLPSVVSALCLLLYDFCDVAVTESDLLLDGTPVASQLSKISCPLEANLAWRWSFHQPWKNFCRRGQIWRGWMNTMHVRPCYS